MKNQLPHLLYLYDEISSSLEKVSRVVSRLKGGIINDVYIEGRLTHDVEVDMSSGWICAHVET